ncbi:DUF3054 domain-containing protein [Corynebacterium sp. HS2168-gen11]|uniref:DUF3054 domain-containing protein n=1 Tax=Corynebacterium sp. HS2168-gen11 TaxID=2974027 RepID=UPI00216AB35E|nr:DUF3054 domain-containing protein [Corynebacterium sp. HS2168-gen11]MCS4535981.1 DUF3054 domain-containing protein [Corynebacterium sp. HS2168-gen11]
MKTLAIDLVIILFFALLARLAHGGLEPLAVLHTWWPFALGVLVGNAKFLFQKIEGTKITDGIFVWAVTALFGLIIWGIRHSAIPHWSFVIVASLMSCLLLVGWRVFAYFFLNKKSQELRPY